MLRPVTHMRSRLVHVLAAIVALSAIAGLPDAGFGQREESRAFPHPAPSTLDENVVLPPAWSFGVVYGAYTNQAESERLIREIIAHDYPIDGFWIDSWFWDWENQGRGPEKYMDFVGDTESYPDTRRLWSMMETENIKAGIWVWDAIFQKGNESVFDEFEKRGFFRRIYFRTDSWHNGSPTTIIGDNSKPVSGTTCGDIDFTNPDAVRHFKQRMKHFFDAGLDFVKLDKTAEIPVCKAMFEMTQELGRETSGRGFILSHSGGTDSGEYKRYPAKWTDDTRSDWSAKAHTRQFSPWLPQVGFKENVELYLDITRPFHEIPFLTNDLGGFAVSTDGYVDEELYLRWLEFAMLVPVTTPFSQPENATGNIAFKISPRADKVFREYSHLKLELFPYIYTYAQRSRLDGVNMIRPLSAAPPAYLFGEEMLVAPVVEQGATQRRVELPAGSDWIDFNTGTRFAGGTTVTVDAPPERLPLFLKAGAIIPRRKYARSIERGTNDVLELHVYAGADGRFELIEDDGTSNDYLRGVYAKTTMRQRTDGGALVLETGPVRGSFRGMGSRRDWQVVIHGRRNVREMSLDGRPIPFERTADGVVGRRFRRAKSQGWTLRVAVN
jgi:alpha-glucosidase (family GH31 glycosyl hydrolase)